MPPAQDAAVPKSAAPTWGAPRSPDFWSLVPHAGMLYARTEAGIAWWDDGEELWFSVKQNPFDVFCMGLAAGNTAAWPICALERDFLFVSFDGCRSWERRSIPFRPAPGIQTALALDPAQSFTVYLFGQGPVSNAPDALTQFGLYWSFNAGRTWSGPLPVGPAAEAMGSVRHGFLAVPSDPSRYGTGGLFMATGRGVYQLFGLPSADNPAEPLLQLTPPDQGMIAAMAVGPRANNPIAVAVQNGLDGRLQVSLDLGKTWTTRNPYAHKFLVDDLLYVDDLMFVKLMHWDPAQDDKLLGAILMSRDDGASFIDITAPDMVVPLTFQDPVNWPREGLAASPTHLYVMSRTMGARSVALQSLRGPAA